MRPSSNEGRSGGPPARRHGAGIIFVVTVMELGYKPPREEPRDVGVRE